MWAFTRCRRPGPTRSPSTTRSEDTQAHAQPALPRVVGRCATAGYPDSIPVSARFDRDPSARVGAVRRGAADVAIARVGRRCRSRSSRCSRNATPVSFTAAHSSDSDYFFLNTRVPPFDDVRARRAVNARSTANAFAPNLGRGFKPTCQILPPNFPGYHPTCPTAQRRDSGPRRRPGARSKRRRDRRRRHRLGSEPDRKAWRPTWSLSSTHSGSVPALKVVPPSRAGPRTLFRKGGRLAIEGADRIRSWSADYPSAGGFIAPLFRCDAFVPASPDAQPQPC